MKENNVIGIGGGRVKTMDEVVADECFAEVVGVLQRYGCAIVPSLQIVGTIIQSRWDVVKL